MQQRLQSFGSFLAAMVVPNIGALLAWGLITALFIPTGWIPNERFAELVSPMIVYLLPILIVYTGGKLVYDTRGGVVGAAATMGVIVGADIPMILGSMLMGPLGGYLIKKIEPGAGVATRPALKITNHRFASIPPAHIATIMIGCARM